MTTVATHFYVSDKRGIDSIANIWYRTRAKTDYQSLSSLLVGTFIKPCYFKYGLGKSSNDVVWFPKVTRKQKTRTFRWLCCRRCRGIISILIKWLSIKFPIPNFFFVFIFLFSCILNWIFKHFTISSNPLHSVYKQTQILHIHSIIESRQKVFLHHHISFIFHFIGVWCILQT